MSDSTKVPAPSYFPEPMECFQCGKIEEWPSAHATGPASEWFAIIRSTTTSEGRIVRYVRHHLCGECHAQNQEPRNDPERPD